VERQTSDQRLPAAAELMVFVTTGCWSMAVCPAIMIWIARTDQRKRR
jgi:hypothetical protein